jgi:hypothetical protein
MMLVHFVGAVYETQEPKEGHRAEVKLLMTGHILI